MKKSVVIRHEEPKDFRVVEEITRDAFWNLYVPGASEHLIVHTMRNHADIIPELTYLLCDSDKILGSIFYTKAKIVHQNRRETDVISFGPVSIAPEFHGQGFGNALITHSTEAAKKCGYRAIIITGDWNYYARFGFVGAKKYGITMNDGKYYTCLLALPLYAGALDGMSGCVNFSSVMEPDENAVIAFEKTFPHKELFETESQKKFQIASQEIDFS